MVRFCVNLRSTGLVQFRLPGDVQRRHRGIVSLGRHASPVPPSTMTGNKVVRMPSKWHIRSGTRKGESSLAHYETQVETPSVLTTK
jgi:hypothetical protein